MSQASSIILTECPRDAMQGWPHFIPTDQKVAYLNSLLQVGFHTIDFGSFVSPKAIPQMADTREVLVQLDMDHTSSKLLAIVANVRGAAEAVAYEQLSYLGFPFSISPTFQQRNTNSTMEESVATVEEIQALCIKHGKTLVLYLSMGFGNPYGDVYNEDLFLHWADEMAKKGIQIISLADTVGLATPEQVSAALHALIPQYPSVNFGVHLHSTATNWRDKLEAAVNAGCLRFDGALKGIGGCPMAQDDLVGNMTTEYMVDYFKEKAMPLSIDETALAQSLQMASGVFL